MLKIVIFFWPFAFLSTTCKVSHMGFLLHSFKVLQPIWGRGSSLMGDGPRTIEIIPNYFDTSASAESPLPRSSDTSVSGEDSPRTSTSASTSHQERNSASSNTSANRPRYLCF